MSKPNHWIKNDGTDITSYMQAQNLANELNRQVWAVNRGEEDNVDYKIAGSIQDPKNEYFIPLIEMLKSLDINQN